MKISKIFLYDEPAISEIQLERLVDFLKQTFTVQVEKRENILKYSKKDTAEKIASCRIFNLIKPFERHIPNRDEIVFEQENIRNTSKTENIIMYDGFELQKILTELIPDGDSDSFHIFFTNKLTCTYDYNDYRYHGRALIGANPSIISTTGIIEAPAKPREYYLELMANYTQGINVDTIKQKYKGTYLEYNDYRLSKIIEGYLLQAIFYYETADAFCNKPECRLFNAHWQKDLIYSQIENCRLCENHQQILKNLTM
ncbi:DUF6775 family putative metallopeptidase [Candidatus Nitrosarchaeum limnium]|uniref:Uncharacterized protein n=1 Tax=Candidatus Nitrosarchaeum limnium BG20 TaxID=859192 RepID=S2EA10_9ARCH|nr:DUF6775 family putative metallopeptidase [Candidatus Nitrosarchaeum limnium]EPA06246.1 hypothetical protein BG20_I2237 [Candidatus Nitrosarchaeum limnium BG20]